MFCCRLSWGNAHLSKNILFFRAPTGDGDCLLPEAPEVASSRIRVNSISPGPIADTEGMRRLTPSERVAEQVKRSVPLQRFGSASEIGDAALFLSSDAAAYVSGVVLPVDGGWSVAGASAAALAMAQQHA